MKFRITIFIFTRLIIQFPEEGLMAYYPFNGDSDDESGNMHHGTVETHFKSSLDEVAFYDRPLTTLEILQLYKRLRPHHEPA